MVDHQPETDPMRLPPALLAIDIFGTLLLAAGIYGMVAEEAKVGAVDLSELALPLVIVGAFLMAPLIIYVIRHVLSAPER